MLSKDIVKSHSIKWFEAERNLAVHWVRFPYRPAGNKGFPMKPVKNQSSPLRNPRMVVKF